jgi:HKD family nuclease
LIALVVKCTSYEAHHYAIFSILLISSNTTKNLLSYSSETVAVVSFTKRRDCKVV